MLNVSHKYEDFRKEMTKDSPQEIIVEPHNLTVIIVPYKFEKSG